MPGWGSLELSRLVATHRTLACAVLIGQIAGLAPAGSLVASAQALRQPTTQVIWLQLRRDQLHASRTREWNEVASFGHQPFSDPLAALLSNRN